VNKYLCFQREQARVCTTLLAISSELQRFRIVTPLRVGNTAPTNCGSWVPYAFHPDSLLSSNGTYASALHLPQPWNRLPTWIRCRE